MNNRALLQLFHPGFYQLIIKINGRPAEHVSIGLFSRNKGGIRHDHGRTYLL